VHRAVAGRIDGVHERGIGIEFAVLDRLGDPGQFLVDDSACADIHVADLGIAHLAGRQSNRFARCLQQGVRAIVQESVPVRRVAGGDGVVRGSFAHAPAVQDQQQEWSSAFHRVFRSKRISIIPYATCD